MNIHRRLIVLVGLGMFLIMTITVLSLQSITAVFSQTTRSVATISLEVRKIWNIEQKIGDAARMVQEYVRTGDGQFQRNYEILHDAAAAMLKEMNALDLGKNEIVVLGALMNDLNTIENKVESIVALDLSNPAARTLAHEAAVRS